MRYWKFRCQNGTSLLYSMQAVTCLSGTCTCSRKLALYVGVHVRTYTVCVIVLQCTWCTDDNAKKQLFDATYAALGEVKRLGMKSVGIPAISTGVYSFPLQIACNIIVEAVRYHWLFTCR